MAIFRPRLRAAALVCIDFLAYATTITRHPISSRESARACPHWYASLVGVAKATLEQMYVFAMQMLRTFVAIDRFDRSNLQSVNQ